MRRFLSVVVTFLFRIFMPFRYYNKPKKIEGSAVICCNHYKATDFFYPLNMSKRPICIIGKKQIYENKFTAYFAGIFSVIPINRDGNDIRAVMECTKKLKSGEVVALFPEGTRNKTEELLLPFKGGSAVFAIRGKAPVIPMMICNRPKAFRMTRIMCGDPIYFTDYYDKKCTSEDFEACEKIIKDTMIELKNKYDTLRSTKQGRKQLSKM